MFAANRLDQKTHHSSVEQPFTDGDRMDKALEGVLIPMRSETKGRNGFYVVHCAYHFLLVMIVAAVTYRDLTKVSYSVLLYCVTQIMLFGYITAFSPLPALLTRNRSVQQRNKPLRVATAYILRHSYYIFVISLCPPKFLGNEFRSDLSIVLEFVALFFALVVFIDSGDGPARVQECDPNFFDPDKFDVHNMQKTSDPSRPM